MKKEICERFYKDPEALLHYVHQLQKTTTKKFVYSILSVYNHSKNQWLY